MKSRYSFCFACVVSLFAGLYANQAAALSHVTYTPVQITERTDVWIRARVVSVSGPEIGKDAYGDTFRDITVRLQIFDATGEAQADSAIIRSVTSFYRNVQKGSEVFAAFSREDQMFVSHEQLGQHGWYALDADTVKTEYGQAPSEDYWQWLRDVRAVIDARGAASDRALSKWTQALRHGDQELVGMAGDFFQLVRDIPIGAIEFVDAFERIYNGVLASAGDLSQVTLDARYNVINLGHSLAASLRRFNPNDGGDRIIDIIVGDTTALHLVETPVESPVLLEIVQRMTDPRLLARIPQLYASLGGYGYPYFEWLPTAPSEELDAWLRTMLRDPAGHGIRMSLQLARLLRVMANRGEEEAYAYVRGVVDGTEEPPVFEGDKHNIKIFTGEILEVFERKTLSREERLARWGARAVKGEIRFLNNLAHEVTPDDQFLIPVLTSFRADDVITNDHLPYNSSYTRIVQIISDSAFAPVLLEVARKAPYDGVLHSLALCGEKTVAEEIAIAALETELPRRDHREIGMAVLQKAGLILFLGRLEDPSLAIHILPYLEQENLTKIEQALMTPDSGRKHNPSQAWYLRDTALLALAKSGHAEAIPRLERAFEVEDIRGRYVAAMILYALGSDVGSEFVMAYRNRKEREIPELEERWYVDFAGGNVFRSVLRYLEEPVLDELYFDRTRVDFDTEDQDLSTDKGLLSRRGPDLMAMLISHIDHSDPNVREMVISSLRRNTGVEFGYDENASPILRQEAIERWKEYARAQLSPED